MRKITSIIITLLLFFFSVTTVFSTDNADSGSDGSQKAVAGFYRSRDCMYKVSVYVGKKFGARATDGVSSYHLVGNPIILARADFKEANGYNLFYSSGNKMQYQAGRTLSVLPLNKSKIHFQGNVPAIPIINAGNITAVKQYFGDTESLKVILHNIAKEVGMTEEALLTSYTYYNAQGEVEKLKAEELLPEKDDKGKYKNKRPFLIVYEPISVGYLTDGKTALAFTATEYAMAQKLGRDGINFFNRALGGDNPQLMWGLTHRDLPNSIFLEESWLGLPARAEVKNRTRTAEWTKQLIDTVSDKIIAGSGIGMRFLKASAELIKAPIESDDTATYRTDTEVITSVQVSAPATGNRIDTFYPGNSATVTFEINGVKKSHSLILPDGGSQLAWVKWRTPKQPGVVHIRVECSDGLYMEDGSNGRDIYANVVSMNENIPPDPQPHDTSKTYHYKKVPIPKEAERRKNTWGEYFAKWHPHLVDNGDWERDENGAIVIPRNWIEDWKDEGWWDWEFRTYEASLRTQIKVLPSDETPTAIDTDGFGNLWKIKSAYGIKVEVKPIFTTNAPNSGHYASTGNSVVTFPEFQYKNYWRLLKKRSGVFEFQPNKYSQWEAPVHFTPLWYPDGDYDIYTETIDYWTPGGMLKANISGKILIQGDVYDDWMAVPTRYE